MSDSGSDDQGNPVGNEGGVVVGDPEESKNQDKVEEEGADEEKGRKVKKAKV
jgi:hypothetical protein